MRGQRGDERTAAPPSAAAPEPGGLPSWVEPRPVAQITFAEWTDDGLLRQPRFQRLREDKDAAEVVRETPQ